VIQGGPAPITVGDYYADKGEGFSKPYLVEYFDSDLPPRKAFLDNPTCRPFKYFVAEALVAKVKSGAISLPERGGVAIPLTLTYR